MGRTVPLDSRPYSLDPRTLQRHQHPKEGVPAWCGSVFALLLDEEVDAFGVKLRQELYEIPCRLRVWSLGDPVL
jgi:hypothetical protein